MIGRSCPGRARRFAIVALAGATLFGLNASAFASSTVALTIASKDPYTNTSSFHKTQVEPDTFSFGTTIVGDVPDGPVHRRRLVEHRLGDLHRQRRDLDARLPPQDHGLRHPARAVGPDQRPIRRLRRQARRVDDRGLTLARHHRRGRPRQPVDRRRPDLGEPGHRCPQPGNVLRQDVDRLRQLGRQPELRELLRRVRRRRRRRRDEDGPVHRRRADLDAPRPCPSGFGLGGQPVAQPNGTVVVPVSAATASTSLVSTDGGQTYAGLPRRLGRPSTAPPGTFAPAAASRRPRSTPPARSTWSGTTAGSAAAAPPTTS